jgi:hypothetical protein
MFVHSEVSSKKPEATINSLPLELDFMIVEWLPLKLPEQVAVQYFAFDEYDIVNICYDEKIDLHPSSFKFLLKNKGFQIKAYSYQKTWAAVRTLDLDFVRKYLEQVQPDLNEVLVEAAYVGFTDAVKLLLSDSRVVPSVRIQMV